MASTSDDNELVELCGKVRDGVVTRQELVRLEQRLLGEQESLWFYRQFMSICSGLEQIAMTETADLSLWIPRLPTSPSSAPSLANSSRPNAKSCQPRRLAVPAFKIRSALVLAASLLVIVSWVFLRKGDAGANHLAAIVKEHQSLWSDQAAPKGSQFSLGKYVLESGASQIQFANEAELLIQAPTVISIDSPTQVTLHSGSLTLIVPSTAKGFRVDTSFGSVVDHGTRIGILSNENDGLEVHVFEGKAETLPTQAMQGAIVEAGEAVSVRRVGDSDASLTLARTKANQSLFAESIDKLFFLPKVQGDIELLVSPPRAVRRIQSELVDKGRATLFLERSGVPLTGDLIVSDASASHAVLDQKQVLAQNSVVDVYMVHLTVPRKLRRTDRHLVASGSIRFAQPVVGVLVHEPGKFGRQFGNPSTDYPTDKLTGLENDIDGNSQLGDRVTLSDDRLTLNFHLNVHGREAATQEDFIDQFRIFVQSH